MKAELVLFLRKLFWGISAALKSAPRREPWGASAGRAWHFGALSLRGGPVGDWPASFSCWLPAFKKWEVSVSWSRFLATLEKSGNLV